MNLKKYLPLILFIISSIILLYTSYPSIGWWDSGHYAFSSYNLSIPGPGGSILYILIGRLFSIIFFFIPVIKRITLVSILSTSISSVLFYYVLTIILGKFQKVKNEKINITVSFFTALCIPFLYSVWIESNVSRVYTLGLLLTGLIILLTILIWTTDNEDKKLKLFFLLVFILGLDFSAHRLNSPFFPVIFILLFLPLKKFLLNYKFWFFIIITWIMSFSIHF